MPIARSPAAAARALSGLAVAASLVLPHAARPRSELPSVGSSASLRGDRVAQRAGATASGSAHPSHVFVVIFENQAADAALGPDAPYLASLAARYGNATNYDATTHPSSRTTSSCSAASPRA